MEKGLGRIHIPDDRDKNFLMKSVLPQKAEYDTHFKYYWTNGWWGDQLSTPQCVAYAWIHWLEDGSITQKHAKPPVVDPYGLYKAAQRVDYWAGENYDGTSVRAGAKILQDLGYIDKYTWAWNIEDLIAALMTTAPVVVGTTWWSGMDNPSDKESIIKVSGYPRGGHAYVLNGINLKTGMIRMKNSWGREWGNNGYAYISIEDMEKLINDYGEICLASEIEKM